MRKARFHLVYRGVQANLMKSKLACCFVYLRARWDIRNRTTTTINEKPRANTNFSFDTKVVDFFLDELKGGTLWFPDFLRSDWKGSHYSKYDFLQYSLPNDKKIVRLAMALLIEQLRLQPTAEETLEDVAVSYFHDF